MSMDAAQQQGTNAATAGVVARAPLLFVAALVLGFVSDHLLGSKFRVPRMELVHWVIAASLILIGLGLAAAGIRNFTRAGTPVPTVEPTRTLVTTGVHGCSRNPIYLGMFLIYAGIGISVRSPSILILTLLLAVVVRYGVVAREESYLKQRFGDAYLAYKARVRRWL